MRISKKLIAQTCLPIYKELLEKGKKDSKAKFLNRLERQCANYGICAVYDNLPSPIGDIYGFLSIIKICKVDKFGKNDFFTGWYYKVPEVCETKQEMVECINKRVQLLESWL